MILSCDRLMLKIFQSVEIRNAINDALYLRSLNENASLSVPIQPTLIWSSSLRNEWPRVKPEDIYYDSAIVSAMLESVTVPLRSGGIFLADKMDTDSII
ncbi:hypothetical protein C0992_003950 [Termitomyces sp. T32_za158]|nr:hypothetical protein C0992_003950 [Termitomyces sp. T32_za158]